MKLIPQVSTGQEARGVGGADVMPGPRVVGVWALSEPSFALQKLRACGQ